MGLSDRVEVGLSAAAAILVALAWGRAAAAGEAASAAAEIVAPDGNSAASREADRPGQAAVAEPSGGGGASARDQATDLAEVIVTAQKRDQNVNDVGMSISALGASELQSRGVTSVADLARVVPGFIFSATSFSNPVYSIRGIGFYEPSLAVTPAVTVYVDEVPLPYPAMTSYADLDLERVEVLKGPQGTVFGQNATGGAINYIAAKPTEHFAAGTDVSYERFNLINAGGFVSGPVNDALSIRVAVRAASGGDWQKSLTRDDELGNQSRFQGRMLLDFHPTERLTFMLNLNGWLDKSDPQAAQVIAYFPSHPQNPNAAIISALPTTAPPDSRGADWNPGFPQRDNSFYQAALRANYKLSDEMTLTSITAYERFSVREQNDDDGFAVHKDDSILGGGISSFSEELRLAGQHNRFNWLLGASYGHDKSRDTQFALYPYSSNNPVFPGKTPPLGTALSSVDLRARTLAGFANLEYEVVDGVTLQAGGRYTDDRRDAADCFSGDAALSETFDYIQQLIKGSVVPIPPGGCITLDDLHPANYLNPVGVLDQTLHQHNVSWRGGVNWKLTSESLLYANVSKGYKAGAFGTLPYEFASQAKPVTQESVTAYETGFKQALFSRHLHVNGAAFYYDYANKQLHAKVLNPIFGGLDSLVNIPKSQLWGAEIQLQAMPLHGLNLNLGATYLNSRILGSFVTYPQFGPRVDVGGNPFPYTPKVIVTGDAQYRWDIGGRLSPFVGAGVTSNSRTTGDIGNNSLFEIRGYTVLDARAGLFGPDDKWRLSVYGKNIANINYWSAAYTFATEQAVRIAARPATYGISFDMQY